MEEERKIETLQRMIDTHEKHRIFWRRGCIYGERNPGFPERGWSLPSEIRCSAGDDFKPQLFSSLSGKVLCFLPRQNASGRREPNAAHKKLAELEAAGKLKAIVTQNIDGLHQAAGSKVVYELHGSTHRNYCMKCGASCDAELVRRSSGVPRCEKCGGMIKPDVVLYEESLNEKVLDGAIRAIAAADLLIVGGTSLAVYPAAGLLQYFRGDALVLINKGATPMDNNADLLIQQPIGQVLGSIRV